MRGITTLVLGSTLLAVLAIAVWLFNSPQDSGTGSRKAALQQAGIILLAQPRSLPALQLLDQDGQPFSPDSLKGRWSLLFFGYTFCPDICPATLAQLRQVYQRLPQAQREQLNIVLVSVDPERDRPQQLKDYLAFFDPSFRGLTGDLSDIQSLSSSLSIPFIPGDSRKPNYTVDHSGNLAVLGPDGLQHGFIRAPLQPDALFGALPLLLDSSH